MTSVHFVGSMIDSSTFSVEAPLALVIEAIDLEAKGDDLVTDDFIYSNFSVDAGIAVNAFMYESAEYLVEARERLINGGRIGCKGLITEFGASTNLCAATTAFKCKEY